MSIAFKGAILCVAVVLGLSPLLGQAPRNPRPAEEFVGPPDPRLDIPPELDLRPTAPDPTGVVDQSLEALLGRTSKDYLLPSPAAALRAILGFVFVLCLAYVAGHPGIAAIERRLGIAHAATTGVPFVLLGLIAAQPSVGVLTPAALTEIAPLLTFALGWIGLSAGLHFNASFVGKLPPGAGSVLGFSTALPLIGVAVVCAAAMRALAPDVPPGDLLRDALLLGTAGALTARSAPDLWRERGFGEADIERMQRLVQLERIVGVGGLLVLAAYFRPQDTIVAWQLPGTAWLFLSIGVGFALGGVFLAVLSSTDEATESLPLFLGAIAFAAGMARYLRLSSLAVCFLVGVLAAAFPAVWKQNVDQWAARLERPIYFVFLTVVGALWRPGDWRGWALMAVFVCSRLGWKWVGAYLLTRRGSYEEASRQREWLTFAPAGAISLAIVVNAQNLFSGPRLSWIVTSVIVGSLVSEMLVQLVLRRPQPAS